MDNHTLQSQMTGFSSALTSICEGRVKVVCDGQACTDGNTIHLPRPEDFASEQVVDREEVAKTLYGIGCHEASHVFYDTPRHLCEFVDSYSHKQKILAAACYNAVVDCADETRFERRFGLASDYFAAATTACLRKRMSPGTGKLPLESWHDVLVAAILAARANRISDDVPYRVVLWTRRSNRLVKSSALILEQAKCSSGKGGPKRTTRTWGKLAQLARDLMRKIEKSNKYKTSAPAPSDSGRSGRKEYIERLAEFARMASGRQRSPPSAHGSNGSPGQDSKGSRSGTDKTQPGSASQASGVRHSKRSGKPRQTKHKNVSQKQTTSDNAALPEHHGCGFGGVVGEVHRELIAEGTGGRLCKSHSTANKQRSSAFAPGGFGHAETFLVNVCVDGRFRRYARELLSAQGPVLARASCTGPILGDLTRFKIDGRALMRKTEQHTIRTAIAVVLDCSGSMEYVLPQVASTAASMARALKDAGGNVGCWHYGTQVRRRSLEQMNRVYGLGGTSTHLAMRAARQWLGAQPEERKVCCIFTDGQPNDTPCCVEEAKLYQRHNLKLLVGTLNGCERGLIHASMPGASVFTVDRLEGGFRRAMRRIAE